MSLTQSVKFSTLAGMLKVAAQILVALLVYPAILQAEGISVLGVWVLLQILVGYGGLVHLGMAPVITKNIAISENNNTIYEIRCQLGVALLYGVAFSSIWVSFITLVSDKLITTLQVGIDTVIPLEVLWFVLIGVLLRLFSALYGAALSGIHRNHFVHVAQLLQALVFTIAFFSLAHPNGYLMDLAISYALSFLVELLFTVSVLLKFNRRTLTIRSGLDVGRFVSFAKSVRPYFFMDAALLGREPLLKLALSMCCGSASVGIYELASKVPSTIRQAYVLGLSALMPAFAKLTRKGTRVEIVALGQTSLKYIIFGAIGALFLYLLNRERLLEIWLGSVEPEILSMTVLLTFWWMITSFNVPAWWIGIGTDNEWSNTYIASTHLVFTIGLFLTTLFIDIGAYELVLLWVLGGVGMQILLYVLLEKKTGFIRVIYLSGEIGRSLVAFSLLALFVVIVSLAASNINWFSDSRLFTSVLLYLSSIGIFLLISPKLANK